MPKIYSQEELNNLASSQSPEARKELIGVLKEYGFQAPQYMKMTSEDRAKAIAEKQEESGAKPAGKKPAAGAGKPAAAAATAKPVVKTKVAAPAVEETEEEEASGRDNTAVLEALAALQGAVEEKLDATLAASTEALKYAKEAHFLARVSLGLSGAAEDSDIVEMKDVYFGQTLIDDEGNG